MARFPSSDQEPQDHLCDRLIAVWEDAAGLWLISEDLSSTTMALHPFWRKQLGWLPADADDVDDWMERSGGLADRATLKTDGKRRGLEAWADAVEVVIQVAETILVRT